MSDVAQSPLPKKKIEEKNGKCFGFDTIIKRLLEGKKIHKLEWEDKEYYGFIDKGILCLHKPDGKIYQWVVSDGDLSGTDWIIIN